MTDSGRIGAEVYPPGEFLGEELEARGWTQADFAQILGKDPGAISEIITARRSISTEMARAIGEALGTGPEVWLNLEAAYQLYKSKADQVEKEGIARRADLWTKYPVRGMLNRNWIEPTDNVDLLAQRLNRFFAHEIPFAARKADDEEKRPLQLAFLHRAYQIASQIPVDTFSRAAWRDALDELRDLLSDPMEIRRVPRILSEAGVRFLAIEALPRSKIDGVCFWLDKKSPVIALSLRMDRIDNFWFTLAHECSHVMHGHGQKEAIIDNDILDGSNEISDQERTANADAESFCIPVDELEDFIVRARPFFYGKDIARFAKRIGVHPGIVVGQLQHRKLVGFNKHRRYLERVRTVITTTAVCDGWEMHPSGVG